MDFKFMRFWCYCYCMLENEYVGIYELLWSHLEIVEQCKYSNIKLFHEFMLTGLCHDFYFMPGQQNCYCCVHIFHSDSGSPFWFFILSRFFPFPQQSKINNFI